MFISQPNLFVLERNQKNRLESIQLNVKMIRQERRFKSNKFSKLKKVLTWKKTIFGKN